MRSEPTKCLAARGETPAAFGRRCIPADCVAPPSHIPDMLGRRALSSGRLAALGATPAFHHGLVTKLRLKPPSKTEPRRSERIFVTRRPFGPQLRQLLKPKNLSQSHRHGL